MAASEPRKREQPGSRQRLIAATSRLLVRQGYAATGVKEIAREGSAPMGSFYFHFPGGKEELGVAALRHGAAAFGTWLRETLEGTDSVADALEACALGLAEDLERSDWLDGCPVATTALESVARSPALRAASAEAFHDWQAIIRDRLTASGMPDATADELAASTLSLLEGAELLARVQGTATPLRHAAATLRTLGEAAPRTQEPPS